MERLAKHAEGLGRSDDAQMIEVVVKDPAFQLVRGFLDPDILFLLLEIGLVHRRTMRVTPGGLAARAGCSRSVGF